MSCFFHLNEGLETLVFGHQVLVEVYGFVVTAAELFVHPLHGFPAGPWELWWTQKCAGSSSRTEDDHNCSPHPSYLGDQDVSYPVDDEATVVASSLQLTLPFPLKEAEEELRVKVYQVIQNREELIQNLHVHLQLFL